MLMARAAGATEKRAHLWPRDDLDWYVEPESATAALLRHEDFRGSVWDPACGQGNIVKTLRDAGVEAYGTDIRRRTEDRQLCAAERDFFSDHHYSWAVNIVTNPPFFKAKGAEAFIRRALEITVRKVAVFVDMRFLTGAARANGLFADLTPHRVWIVTPRVSCPPGSYLAAGGKASGGTADYCWIVWDQTPPRPAFAQTGWLRLGSAPIDRS